MRTLKRTVMMIVALLLVDSTATSEITARVGENVLLPCNCPEGLQMVSWQTEKNLIVNHYNAKENDSTPPDDQFKNRSQLFHERGNCSLLLFNVGFQDRGIFHCHFITANSPMDTVSINLTITEPLSKPEINPSPGSFLGAENLHGGPLVGGVLSVALLVGGAIVALLLRKHYQRIQRREDCSNQQTERPLMNIV